MTSTVCSVHGKNRTVANLVDDGSGGMKCSPMYPCKTTGEGPGKGAGKKRKGEFGSPMEMMMNMMGMGSMGREELPEKKRRAVQLVVCTVHFKERGTENMQDDGNGGMCCKPGAECQGGASGKDLRNEFCFTHKKKRNVTNLMDNGCGGFTCKPGFQCVVGSGPKPGFEQVTCSVHGKTRSMLSMQEDGAGGHKCAPGFECQQKGELPLSASVSKPPGSSSSEQVMCSVHGKNRTMDNMVGDANGGWKCGPGFECQGSGEKGGGKKGMKGALAMMMLMSQMKGKGGKGKGDWGNGKGKGDWGKQADNPAEWCKWCQMGECWNH